MSRSFGGRLVVTASLLATIGIVWSGSAARTATPPVVVDRAKTAPAHNPAHDEAACKCVCKACQAAKAKNTEALVDQTNNQEKVRQEIETESQKANAHHLYLSQEVDLKLKEIESINAVELVEIPDAPPPHEGAKFELPYIIQTPDVLNIELLLGLPERPLSGEFTVRPDGTVNLGYYGSIKLDGLSLERAKFKIIVHFRDYLTDFALGLWKENPETGEMIFVDPSKSNNLYVDVSEYNSHVYYVLGDTQINGRFPWQGNEYVLDALENAGGFIPSADSKAIRLYRPARGKKPAKTYTIDYDAVLHGEVKSNLQLFPGDRLVVGRREGIEPKIPQ